MIFVELINLFVKHSNTFAHCSVISFFFVQVQDRLKQKIYVSRLLEELFFNLDFLLAFSK
jgi:hypothetical protein